MKLKPCPFCGGAAYIERVGDNRKSTIYECGACGCRLETGEEFNHGGTWNRRIVEEQLASFEEEFQKQRETAAAMVSHRDSLLAACEKERDEYKRLYNTPVIESEWQRMVRELAASQADLAKMTKAVTAISLLHTGDVERLQAENARLREALERLLLCDMAEVRTIPRSSGAIQNAREALAGESK